MTRTPYKLLDYYRYEDADLFFGREEETRRIVEEILSSRLLVLFSSSGSGKTSLINAGVRPELEKMGYQTIYTRMEDAPIPAVCRAVSEKLELPPGQEKEKESLYEFLKKVAQTTGKPLVIFLDQLEEFFIVFRNQPALRQEFIQQAARIRNDDQLPVFLVFSLGEEYFGNLHEFRKAIPSIFQNNANIRLEPFDEKDARRAITEPLQNKDIEDGKWRFEKQLVDSIIKDLKTNEGIEPIKLEMVCHFLWTQRSGESNEIPLSIYQACGGSDVIISNFIKERLKQVPGGRHKLMIRVFEALKTPDNTKRYRSFQDLQSQLDIKKPQRLKTLLQQLANLDVVREEERSGTSWYEFKHDYIAVEISHWIKERKESLYRKRLRYAVLPLIILFLSLFTYLFIRSNTFYIEFSKPQYESQQEEIIITRDFNPFNEYITTGYFKDDLDGFPGEKKIRNRLKLGFWGKNNWQALADTLPPAKSGNFLFQIGETDSGIEKLSQALKGKYFPDRSRAAFFLGRLGKSGKTIIDTLIRALQDEDILVKRQAADALVRLGRGDERVIDALRLALKKENFHLRLMAAYSLVPLGKADKTVIDTLIQGLETLGGEDFYLRLMVASSLGRLGKGDKNAIDALIMALRHKDYNLQQQAAESLGRLGKGNKKVIDALILALEDNYPPTQFQAADSLIRLGNRDKRVIDTLILAVTKGEEDFGLPRYAAQSLGRLGQADKKVIAALMQAMKEGIPHVRDQAADSLVQLGKVDKRVIAVLRQELKNDNNYVRLDAADILVRLGKGDKQVIDTLKRAIKDRNYDIQVQAAGILVRLGQADEKAIDILIQDVKYKYSFSPPCRQEAVRSLGRLDQADDKVIAILIQALKDNYSDVQVQAAESLGRLGQADKKVIDALIEALKHSHADLRFQAAESLGRLGRPDKNVIDALMEALQDAAVRPKAAESLGTLWQDKSEAQLIEYLKHPLSGYRIAAANALVQKKSISQATLDEINRLKDTDKRPWVRLGAWKAYELIVLGEKGE